MCASGAVIKKAGANVSTAIISGWLTASEFENWIAQAESFINVATRTNYSDTYAALNTDVQKILEDAASSHAAIQAINYDMSGYTSRAEAQVMLDVNWARLAEAIKLLRDKKSTDFINAA